MHRYIQKMSQAKNRPTNFISWVEVFKSKFETHTRLEASKNILLVVFVKLNIGIILRSYKRCPWYETFTLANCSNIALPQTVHEQTFLAFWLGLTVISCISRREEVLLKALW